VKIRANEAREAASRLGVPSENVVFLGFPDGRLGEHLPSLAQRLASIMADTRPDDLLVTSAVDRHPDHIALGHAIRSLAPTLPTGCRVAEYPVWSWVVGPWSPRGERWSKAWSIIGDPLSTFAGGRPELVRTSGYLERKQQAIEAYCSQTSDLVGGVGSPALADDFLTDFLQPFEVFFPLGVQSPRRGLPGPPDATGCRPVGK
jgi:LmbE family N-acetylglucosaminyl deacetylase